MKNFIAYFTAKNILFDAIPLLVFITGLLIALSEERYEVVGYYGIMVTLTGVIVLNRHMIKSYINLLNSYRLLQEQEEYTASLRDQLIGELKRTLKYSYADQDKLKDQIKALKATLDTTINKPVTPKKNAKQTDPKPKNV